MIQKVWPAATIALVFGLSNGSAWAQATDPQAIAAAQSLVDEASDLMDAGKFDAACPKLEQATKLVPSGVGARLALAECYVGQGKLASAQGQYLQAEALATTAKDSKRAKEAGAEAAKLKGKLATITLVVPNEVRQLEGVALTWDEVSWEPGTWGAPIPVDMGKHVLVVKATGYKPWKQDVNVEANGRAMEQAVPMLEKLPLEVVKPLPRAQSTSGRVESTSSLGPVFWAAAGLMIVGIGGGTGFFVASRNKDDEAASAAKKIALNRNVNEQLCPVGRQDPACSDMISLESRRNFLTNIGIAGVAVGGAAAATMMIYAFIGPGKNQGSAKNEFIFVPTPGGVSFSGTF